MPFANKTVTTKTYDWLYKTKNVDPALQTLIKNTPIFLGLIRMGKAVNNMKVQWADKQLASANYTVSGFSSPDITVADTTGLKVGDTIRIEEATGESRGETLSITALTGTVITVAAYSGHSIPAIIATDVVKFVSRPGAQGKTFSADATVQPVERDNVMQNFDYSVACSRNELNQGLEYVSNVMLEKEMEALNEIMLQMNNAAIWGLKRAWSSGVNGTLSGLFEQMSGGVVESTGGAISPTILNNLLEEFAGNGGASNNYALICAPNQARKISGFNTSGTNPLVTIDQKSREAGQYVSRFVGDLPSQAGFTAQVIVDFNFPKDRIAMVDLNKIFWIPQEGGQARTKDTTNKDFDGLQRTAFATGTLKVKDAKYCHGIATGLNV